MRAIHPGEILKEELEVLGLNASALARELNVPINRITSILHAKRAITADTALRLARFFNTTAVFWLNLQATYDLKIAEQTFGKKIQGEVHRFQAAA